MTAFKFGTHVKRSVIYAGVAVLPLLTLAHAQAPDRLQNELDALLAAESEQPAAPAQEPTADPAQDPAATAQAGAQAASEDVEPPSELDLLSRKADDAYVRTRSDERVPVSVTLRALDKITARYTDIEATMNQMAHFGALEIVARTCDKRPPEEFPETTAFIEIFDRNYNAQGSNLKRPINTPKPELEPIDDGVLAVEAVKTNVIDAASAGMGADLNDNSANLGDEGATLPNLDLSRIEGDQPEGENVFRGWMFASSPALNPLEHGVYDVWVIDCKTAAVVN